jgi:signal transduction histidine kinase
MGSSGFHFKIALTIFITIIGLGYLQYRWLDQVRDAEKQRLEENLQASLSRLADDLDREISRAYISFATPWQQHRDLLHQEFGQRQTRWLEEAPYAPLIKDYFLFDHEGFYQFVDDQFTVVPEPQWFQTFKDQLQSRGPRGPRLLFEPQIPALIVPRIAREMRNFERRRRGPSEFMILMLDMEWIRDEFMPHLVEKHLNIRTTDDYHFSLSALAENDARTELFSSHQAIRDPEADGRIRLFALRSFPELAYLTGGDSRLREHARNLVRGMRIPGGLGDAVEGRWMLTVAHQSGSLDTVVTKTRNRNLLLGFGTLILLGGSMLLMLRTTQRAKTMARQQIEFVAGISHELMTPLAGIRSAAQNLADKVVDASRVADYGRLIERESTRLSTMVEQVLEYAGMESNHKSYARQELSINEVIEEGLGDCKIALADTKLEVRKDIEQPSPNVIGDQLALRQVVRNLVLNATKYAANGKELHIKVATKGQQIIMEIRDFGPGIDPDDLTQIFDPFYRGSKVVASTISGSGLGLCLVKHILSGHHGQIEARNHQDGGTIFTVTLPLSHNR